MSHNPMDLHGLLHGQLYLYIILIVNELYTNHYMFIFCI
jgi:hypothetical protein